MKNEFKHPRRLDITPWVVLRRSASGAKFCHECGASQAPAKCANYQHEPVTGQTGN